MAGREADTIAAIASPAGAGRRGVIRISGRRSLELAGAVFVSADGVALDTRRGRGRVEGEIVAKPGLAVRGAAYLFRGPASYTREDMVELHLPGSAGALALVMDRLVADGARAAEAGEFTARAFRNGALEAGAIEGVAQLIYARSDGQLRAARRQMDGALAREAAAAREALDELRSLVEAGLDFADEDVSFIAASDLCARLDALAGRLQRVMAADAQSERLHRAATVVLAGPANAGKSTLMNRLSGLERALCSPVAGTTRDVLSAPLALRGGEVLLCDTPGLLRTRRSAADAGADEAERVDHRAQRAAAKSVAEADVVVWVTAVDEPTAPPQPNAAAEESRSELEQALAGRPAAVVAANKCDLPTADSWGRVRRWLAEQTEAAVEMVSGLTGAGCVSLCEAIERALGLEEVAPGDAIVLSVEQRHALERAAACMDRAIELAAARGAADSPAPERAADAPELVAEELAEASRALDRLTGQTDIEQIYGRIYARFCVGK